MRWRTMARICYACKGTSTPCPDSYCNGLIKVIVMFSDWSTAWPCLGSFNNYVDKKRGRRWTGECLWFCHKTSVFYFFLNYLEKSSLTNWISSLFRIGSLLPVQSAKIKWNFWKSISSAWFFKHYFSKKCRWIEQMDRYHIKCSKLSTWV